MRCIFLSKSLWECFTNLENIELQKFFAGLRPAMIDGYPVIGPPKKFQMIYIAILVTTDMEYYYHQ